MITKKLDKIAESLEISGHVKMAAAIDAVANTMSKFAAVEREAEMRIPLLEIPEEVRVEGKQELIEQAFIAKSADTDVRVRKTTIMGEDGEPESKYTMTAKHRPLHQEAETEISQEIYEGLSPIFTSVMAKTRYKWKGWDIDDIHEGNDIGKIVAEYEYGEEDKTIAVPLTWKVKA